MSVSGDRVEEGTESPAASNDKPSYSRVPQQRPGSPAPSYVSMKIDRSRGGLIDFRVQHYSTPQRERNSSICVLTEETSRCAVCDQVLTDPVGEDGCPKCGETFTQTRGLETPHQTCTGQMDVSLQEFFKTYMISLTKRLEGQRDNITGPRPGTSFNRIFTSLYITEGDSKGVNQQHEVWQLEISSKMEKTLLDKPIKCSDIFKPLPGTKTPIRIVLTKGIAGIGKTFSVCKFTLDWARYMANRHIDLLILISFRELNLVRHEQYSVLTLIHDFHPTLKRLTAEQLAACKTVFIFDGLDESRISLNFRNNYIVSDVKVTSSVGVLLTNLIKGNLLPSAQLWVTTRPAAANQIPPQCVDRVTEVRGFTDPQKKEYFSKRFSDETLASTIISHINASRSLYIMCHIPLFCWIAATVLEDMLKTMLKTDKTGQLPTTLTEMYSNFVSVQTRRKKQKYDETNEVKYKEKKRKKKPNKRQRKKQQDENQQENTETDWEVLLKLGKLAFAHLEKGSIMFYQEDLEECGLDVTEASLYSGVCTEIFKSESVLFQTKVYSFVHLSIQEFLAAVYLLHCFTERNRKVLKTFLEHYGTYTSHMSLDDFLNKAMLKALFSKNGHLDLMVRFLHGLTLESNQSLLGGLLGQTENSPKSIQRTINNLKEMATGVDVSPDRCINIFHCLMEMKDESVNLGIQQYLKSGDRSKIELSETQCSALAHMLLMSEEVLDEFDLSEYNTSPFGMQRLLPAVRNCRKARLAYYVLNETNCEALVLALSSNPSHLIELQLTGAPLNDATVKMLCDAMKSPHCRLQILTLSDCRLSESCCKHLASVLCSNSSLQELDLSYNDLTDAGVTPLFPGLKSQQCRLKILRLRQANLTKKCCKEFSSHFSSNSSSLTELDLSFNELQNSGVKLLSVGLKSPHCTLEILRLSHCLVSDEGFSCLASALSSNLSHLKELDLSFNQPGDLGRENLLSVGLATLKLDKEEPSLPPQLLKTCACPLTLDTNTAAKDLFLSENNRKVTRMTFDQSYPDHPDRFQGYPQVLCRESLTGCCYWEVEWSGWFQCAVTYRGINRGGLYGQRTGLDCMLGYNDKSWCLFCESYTNRYCVLHNKKRTVLPVRPSGSNRVAVYVDWPAGMLSFYRVSSDSHTHLHTFRTTFTEPLYPGFVVYPGSSVSLCQIDPVVPSSFSPIVHTKHTTNEYRFQVPRPGLFQCSETGLVFGMTGEGEVLYRTVQWDERWLQSTGGTPAGPLFDIQCPQKSVCQLHLPHCAITPGDDLCVANITDEGVYFLEPLKMTKTHVVVNVKHLSLFGLSWILDYFLKRNPDPEPKPKPTHGQVLLFLRPPSNSLEMKVFLLPSNVLIKEVKVQHEEDKYMDTTSQCVLIPSQRYILHCPSHEVQPEAETYLLNYGPNYHPLFEVSMDLDTEHVLLELRGPEDERIWQRRIKLKVKSGRSSSGPSQPTASTVTVTSQEDETLVSARKEFIKRVSGPVLDGLLDTLLDEKVLNDGEMDLVRGEKDRKEKARKLIDMVRKKGNEASSKMIAAFQEEDPTLYHELGLDKPLID